MKKAPAPWHTLTIYCVHTSSECCCLVLSGSKPFRTLGLKSQVRKSINAATWPSYVSKLEGSILFIMSLEQKTQTIYQDQILSHGYVTVLQMTHISKPMPPFKLAALFQQLLKDPLCFREKPTPPPYFVLRQMRGRNAANCFKPLGVNGRLDTVNTWSNTALQWWTDTRQRESWPHFISAAWFLFPLSRAREGKQCRVGGAV